MASNFKTGKREVRVNMNSVVEEIYREPTHIIAVVCEGQRSVESNIQFFAVTKKVSNKCGQKMVLLLFIFFTSRQE